MPIASTPPPPLDDPTISDILHCPPLQWGMIGCGRVCHDFVQALKHLPTATVVACSTRDDVKRAQEFADKHGVEKAYGNYDELINDPKVQIVYVGNVHAFRRPIVEKCILANKHTLVEKPFACSTADAEYLIGLAKERNIFIMEGMWTRFFPAVEKARRLVFGGGESDEPTIGEVTMVASDFNFNASDSEEYPTSFVYQRKLGGGATLLTGPYPVAASTLFFGSREPDKIQVTGQVDRETEVDLQACVSLGFPPTSETPPALDSSKEENTPKLPGAGVASLTYGMVAESDETTSIVATKGRLTILTPCHCPTGLRVALKSKGRGNAAGQMEYNFPLPEDTEAITKAGGFVYPNSAGFCYEAAAVARCIAAGKTEAPQYTLAETIITMKVLDEVRRQLGAKGTHDE